MDHKITFKNPDEFLTNNMFIDLNNQWCQTKEDSMFKQEILVNHAAHILNAK